MDTRELYQAVIIDHGRHPRNFHENEKATAIQEGCNPLCGDKLVLYLVEKDGVIEDVSFKGEGCAIAMASASLMTDSLKGKTVKAARALFNVFHELITKTTTPLSSEQTEKLGKLQALVGVCEYPMRVKCATLAWHALLAALEKAQTAVTTENETNLITLTDAAADYIKQLLKNKPNAVGFRVSLRTSGCSGYMYNPELVESHPKEDIYILSPQGISIYVDTAYADILKNTVIDFVDKGMGQKQILFQNPQAVDACGCGESFNVKKPTGTE